jgi:hypothetical protein
MDGFNGTGGVGMVNTVGGRESNLGRLGGRFSYFKVAKQGSIFFVDILFSLLAADGSLPGLS